MSALWENNTLTTIRIRRFEVKFCYLSESVVASLLDGFVSFFKKKGSMAHKDSYMCAQSAKYFQVIDLNAKAQKGFHSIMVAWVRSVFV